MNGDAWADLASGGSLTTRRVYLDAVDALFARIGVSNHEDWYLLDYQGLVRDIVNSSGTLIDNLSYGSYGKVVTETSPSNGDRYSWTGRERDTEINPQYNRARFSDSPVGKLSGNGCPD